MSRQPKTIDRAMVWHTQPYTPPARPTLMPHQIYGATFMLAGRGTLLASEPGTGKSAMIIEVINRLPLNAKVLILCPAGLRANWLRECALWLTTPRRCMIALRYIPLQADVVILQYDALAKFESQLRGQGLWTLIALDEAHELKNADSIKAAQILGDAYTTRLESTRKIVATATPILNRPEELWPLLSILGLTITREEFAARFCSKQDRNACPDPEGLRRLIEPILLRQTKADCLQLPRKTRRVISIDATGAMTASLQAEHRWQDECARAGTFAGGVPRHELTAVRIANALAKVALPEVQHRLRSAVQQDGKLVIFCHHEQVVFAVAALFPPTAVVTLTGKLSAQQRLAATDRFQRDPSCCVIVLTIKAGGVGITLTAARRVAFIEYAWSDPLMEQAIDRIHRIGQTRPVLAEYIVIKDSADARALELHVEKQATVDAVFNHPKAA